MTVKSVSLVAAGLALIVGVGALAGVARGDETARGVVFEDLNGDGRLDAGEPGIPDVAVSNQDGVVVTDEQGRYSLPVSDDTIIFVVKPSGYTVPVDEDRLPRFYYIHKPNGSPRLYYGGVDPTGPLPESIDFPLTRVQEPVDFKIIAMTDPQPETLEEVYYVRDDVLSEMVNIGAAFGVTLGDIMGNQLDLFDEHNRLVGQVGIPFYNVIGNHDMNYDAADDRDSDETFHRFFGPNYYSWNYGRVHFIALDSVEWLGPPQGRGRYRGALGERQLRWLERDLALVPVDHLVVLLSHIPITTPEGRAWVDKDGLFEVLKNRKKVLALNGHTHYQEHMFFDTDDGWMGSGSFHQLNMATVCGAWWSGPKDVRGIPVSPCSDGVPNGYTVVTFDGSNYTTDYKAAGFDRDYQMRIYPPGSVGHDDLSKRTILVNVFDGSQRSRVEYSLDRGPFQPMERAPRRDPLAEVLLEGVVDSGKPWAYPVVTQHMWQAELPERPARGAHVVTVRVTDHFGRLREQSSIFGR